MSPLVAIIPQCYYFCQYFFHPINIIRLMAGNEVDNMRQEAEELKKFRNGLGLSQHDMADRLNVTRSAYSSYETARVVIPRRILRTLYEMGFMSEVSAPTIPAGEVGVQLVSIGYVAASSKVDWTDPFESEDFEYVPSHMAEGRGLFSCRVQSDSMLPLLYPEDICVFQRTDVPKIGRVILFRSDDHKVTVKLLKHDGTNYILHPLNSNYSDEIATGCSVGVLVGIVRKIGSRTISDHDPDGIKP